MSSLSTVDTCHDNVMMMILMMLTMTMLRTMMVMLINGWYIEVSSKVPDTILMLLDMDLGTLSFMVDDRSVRQLIVNL